LVDVQAPLERLVWQQAMVNRVVEETPSVKSYFVTPPAWHGFMAGQHVDVRLSAPDGYQAQRSYSIGSAPEAPEVELVIEKLDTGEVSPFFHDVVQVGDTVEMRGPIGGHFVWRRNDGGPLLLVGGGSGVVPLMSILRHRLSVAPEVPTVLVYSVRRFADIIFRDELFARSTSDPNFQLVLTVTRETVADKRVRTGRIDEAFVTDVLARLGDAKPKHTYVCGANAFVDVASRLLIDMGVPFPTIKTERYGGDPARQGEAQRVPEV
jgi:glycine betaine catabolism B